MSQQERDAAVQKIAAKHLDWAGELSNRPKPKLLPFATIGERIVIRERPPIEKTTGGIHIPDTAKNRYFEGILVAAGDQAADKLNDQGVEIGDHVLFAKYAGIVEEWDHVIHEGEGGCPEHAWEAQGSPVVDRRVFRCMTCNAVRVIEPMIIANATDIAADVDLEVRIEEGLVQRYRCKTESGKYRYVIERTDAKASVTTFDYNASNGDSTHA